MISKRISALFSRKAMPDSVKVLVPRTAVHAWGIDLPGTWLVAVTTIAVSGVYTGTGLFAMMVLLVNLCFRVPFAGLARLISKGSELATHRSIFVLVVVSALALIYSSHLDKIAPLRAEPLVIALESYKAKNGSYPRTLDELMPRYLSELPLVKPVLSPPKFRYETQSAGLPHLSFEVTGQFAHYSYDFESKKWNFYD